MKSAPNRKQKAIRQFEDELASIDQISGSAIVLRNHWKDYIAENELFEPEILVRADESRLLFENEDTPIDEAYSIVIVGSNLPVNDGAEIGWVRTR